MPHPFLTRPHRTLLALSAPVMVSLAAEPLTALVDTGFVARLGSAPLRQPWPGVAVQIGDRHRLAAGVQNPVKGRVVGRREDDASGAM